MRDKYNWQGGLNEYDTEKIKDKFTKMTKCEFIDVSRIDGSCFFKMSKYFSNNIERYINIFDIEYVDTMNIGENDVIKVFCYNKELIKHYSRSAKLKTILKNG